MSISEGNKKFQHLELFCRSHIIPPCHQEAWNQQLQEIYDHDTRVAPSDH